MKVLFVAPRYYPYVGGVEYVVKSIAERLVKRGHVATVLCGEPNIDNPKEEWINNVHVVRWPIWSPRDAYHIPRMRSKLEDWLLINVEEYDVVHIHNIHSVFSIYPLRILKNSDIHKVVTPYYHGGGHTFFRKFLWRFWRPYTEKLLDNCIVHIVSKYEAVLVERDYNIKPIVIENGVEEQLHEVDWNPSGYVMYSGRIEKYKNIHRLANIVKILNDMGLNLELKIFGKGPYENELAKRLNRLGLRSEILPFQPFEVYIDKLSHATLLGLLSEKESYPQSVNEANAIGVPVVVAKPWGENFSERPRTLLIDLDKNDKEIAKDIASFLEKVQKQPRPIVPTWTEVAEKYISKLYT